MCPPPRTGGPQLVGGMESAVLFVVCCCSHGVVKYSVLKKEHQNVCVRAHASVYVCLCVSMRVSVGGWVGGWVWGAEVWERACGRSAGWRRKADPRGPWPWPWHIAFSPFPPPNVKPGHQSPFFMGVGKVSLGANGIGLFLPPHRFHCYLNSSVCGKIASMPNHKRYVRETKSQKSDSNHNFLPQFNFLYYRMLT